MSDPVRAWDIVPLMTLFRLRGVQHCLRKAKTRAERNVAMAEREALALRLVAIRAGRVWRQAFEASHDTLVDQDVKRSAARLWEAGEAYHYAADLHTWLKRQVAA